MANNQYVNKVEYAGQTLIDLTSDTVTADKLLQGYTAHDKSGALITGTYIPSASVIESLDSHGGTIIDITTPNVINWEGSGMEFVSTLATKNLTLNDTSWSSYTPSTGSAVVIKASEDLTTFSADLEHYEYLLKWLYHVQFAYASGTQQKSIINNQYVSLMNYIYKTANLYSDFVQDTYGYNTVDALNVVNVVDYFGTGGARYMGAVNYGAFPTNTAPGLSSTSGNTITVTPKTPSISARCHNTYLTTANAGAVDATNTKITLIAKLYRFPIGGSMRRKHITELYDWFHSDINNS